MIRSRRCVCNRCRHPPPHCSEENRYTTRKQSEVKEKRFWTEDRERNKHRKAAAAAAAEVFWVERSVRKGGRGGR